MAKSHLAIELVLDIEKGYTVDSGGPTNYGVTLVSLIAWGDPDGDGYADGDFNRDGRVDVLDVRSMTYEHAVSFYEYWWNRLKYFEISWQPVANKVFDMSVNLGPYQTGLLVQRAINSVDTKHAVVVDGIIGPKTFAALNRQHPRHILPALRMQMEVFYRRIANMNPTKYGDYLDGWLNRAAI